LSLDDVSHRKRWQLASGSVPADLQLPGVGPRELEVRVCVARAASHPAREEIVHERGAGAQRRAVARARSQGLPRCAIG
jgi:hypothetical protein